MIQIAIQKLEAKLMSKCESIKGLDKIYLSLLNELVHSVANLIETI